MRRAPYGKDKMEEQDQEQNAAQDSLRIEGKQERHQYPDCGAYLGAQTEEQQCIPGYLGSSGKDKAKQCSEKQCVTKIEKDRRTKSCNANGNGYGNCEPQRASPQVFSRVLALRLNFRS